MNRKKSTPWPKAEPEGLDRAIGPRQIENLLLNYIILLLFTIRLQLSYLLLWSLRHDDISFLHALFRGWSTVGIILHLYQI